MHTFLARLATLIALAVAVNASSLRAQSAAPVLSRYALDDGPTRQWKLPNRLREISGLTLTADGRLFGHDDERAVVYQIDFQAGTLVKAFAMGDRPVRGDFEGIAAVDDRFYLVSSQGRLYESREGEDDDRLLYNSYGTGVGRSCEVEGLAFEPADRSLLLLCKNPRSRALEGYVAIYRWSVDRRAMAADSLISIPLSDFTRAIEGDEFRPSGIARHPQTGHYIIVAAAQGAIAEVDPEGRVLQVRALRSKSHRQAEGITFGPRTELMIADEGGGGRGTLSLYRLSIR